MLRIAAMGDVSGTVATRCLSRQYVPGCLDISTREYRRCLNVVRESWDFGMRSGFGWSLIRS